MRLHARAVRLEMQERRAQGMLVGLLEGVVVADVVPRSTLPAAWIAPAFASSASASVVLPAAPSPTSATVRMFSVANCAMCSSFGQLQGSVARTFS
jgi:hypothetical protein